MKTASKIAAFVAIVLALGLVVSCGGKSGKSLAGTRWESVETDEDTGTKAGGFVTFTSDKDFTVGMILNEDSSDLYSGTYTSDGKTITMTVFGEDSKGTIAGDKLTFDGTTYTKK
jgi:hypothetical protein